MRLRKSGADNERTRVQTVFDISAFFILHLNVYNDDGVVKSWL